MSGRPVDPATVEVIRNALSSAANEMQRTLIRTAYNTIIYEILDFGISVYDQDLNLVADAPGLTLFLGANERAIERGVDRIGEENFEPGDIYLLNYPYWTGTHTLDVCVFSPIFYEDEIIGYIIIRAHWLDLGAKESGYVIDSTSVHEEGLIFPGTKIYDAGEPVEDMFELLRFNSRTPTKIIGDLNAQIAAIKTGKERIKRLHRKYGVETVADAIEEVLEHGERSARNAIEELPDGSWSAVDYIDNDGITDDPVRMEVEVTIDGDEFTFDFSNSAEEVQGPVNVCYPMTESMCKLCLKSLTTPHQESNGGHYQPMNIIAPEGTIFNATYPAATFTIWTAIVGIEVLYEAVGKGIPTQISASSGGDLCGVILVGEDPQTGQTFIESSNEGVGWGAARDHDGPNALMHISETRVRNIPIEVFETKAPILFDRLSLRQDSGGIGEHRGGLGVRRDYRFLDDVKALTLIKKTKTDGWGLQGGEPGAKNAVVLHRNDGNEPWADRFNLLVDNNEMYGATDDERVKWTGMFSGWFEKGEVLSNRSGGGGGFGDPYDRDPEMVLDDVRKGYVSVESARDEYGVAITEDFEIDHEVTGDLRSA